MRTAEILRKTTETDIRVSLQIDGTGRADVHTGAGFLDHMLTLFAAHGRFDLTVYCKGDLQVDAHHTTEDAGIALGQAFARAAGDARGIARYGSMLLPMDEALVLCAVDFGARAYLAYEMDGLAPRVGDFDTELAEEFFRAFAMNARATLHIKKLSGRNTHHMLEAAFKGAARALAQALAVRPDAPDQVPSTKGVLA